MRNTMETIKEYEQDRLDAWDRIGKLTVAHILADIGDRDPRYVAVEYMGCGSHTIELLDMETFDIERPARYDQ